MTIESVSPWYIEAFEEAYTVLYPHRDDDSAAREASLMVTAMGLRHGSGVLDVCCGDGRHLAAFANMGFDVCGTDLSRVLIRTAAARPGLEGRVFRADIRRLPFEPLFDAVFNLFTSFGYFEEESNNRAALTSMADTLGPGGILVLDHIHRARLEATLVPYSEDLSGNWEVCQHRRIEADRVVKDIRLRPPKGAEKLVRESVRLYTPSQMCEAFEAAGLYDVQVSGSFSLEPLLPTSDRMIVTGRKRGGG